MHAAQAPTRPPAHPPHSLQAGIQALLLALPRYVLACLLAKATPVDAGRGAHASPSAGGAGVPHLAHAARALSTLATLCDFAAQHAQLASVLAGDAFGEQVVDAVTFALLGMAGPEAPRCVAAAGAEGSTQVRTMQGCVCWVGVEALRGVGLRLCAGLWCTEGWGHGEQRRAPVLHTQLPQRARLPAPSLPAGGAGLGISRARRAARSDFCARPSARLGRRRWLRSLGLPGGRRAPAALCAQRRGA